MKKLILPLLLVFFILAGCSNNNLELRKDELFEKKQECLSYKDDMLEFGKNMGYNIWKIEQIFYSNNTCYFVGVETRDMGDHIVRDFKLLFDYLNQEYITETPLTFSNQILDENFTKKIEELK